MAEENSEENGRGSDSEEAGTSNSKKTRKKSGFKSTLQQKKALNDSLKLEAANALAAHKARMADEEEEIILSLTNENKNLKNDYSCLLGQHVGVMLEKNEEVREKKLKEKLDEIKCELEKKIQKIRRGGPTEEVPRSRAENNRRAQLFGESDVHD